MKLISGWVRTLPAPKNRHVPVEECPHPPDDWTPSLWWGRPGVSCLWCGAFAYTAVQEDA